MEDRRFIDKGEILRDFLNNILVACAQCGKCAYGFTHPASIICHQCGFVKALHSWGAV